MSKGVSASAGVSEGVCVCVCVCVCAHVLSHSARWYALPLTPVWCGAWVYDRGAGAWSYGGCGRGGGAVHGYMVVVLVHGCIVVVVALVVVVV